MEEYTAYFYLEGDEENAREMLLARVKESRNYLEERIKEVEKYIKNVEDYKMYGNKVT